MSDSERAVAALILQVKAARLKLETLLERMRNEREEWEHQSEPRNRGAGDYGSHDWRVKPPEKP
jgi:hypothetical protein